MEWNGGVDYWSGVLDWTTGVPRYVHKLVAYFGMCIIIITSPVAIYFFCSYEVIMV